MAPLRSTQLLQIHPVDLTSAFILGHSPLIHGVGVGHGEGGHGTDGLSLLRVSSFGLQQGKSQPRWVAVHRAPVLTCRGGEEGRDVCVWVCKRTQQCQLRGVISSCSNTGSKVLVIFVLVEVKVNSLWVSKTFSRERTALGLGLCSRTAFGSGSSCTGQKHTQKNVNTSMEQAAFPTLSTRGWWGQSAPCNFSSFHSQSKFQLDSFPESEMTDVKPH